ncbi:MAG: nitroreductase/quinone reductase family protein [Acidimicrobiales bacterium]|jgi:deazaflavin-dependent oxidoreductase (nitroreductase family)
MPSDAVLKTMNYIHRGVLAITRGRVGWVVARMPAVKLTTTGRNSGRKRQVILTTPYQNRQFILIVASRGGDDRHPDWYLNLLVNPNATIVDLEGVERAVTASLPDRNQYSELWGLVIEKHPRYLAYQKKTERQIPLVLLTET